MRVHVVSDVHGNADALARAGDGADALLVLGDLLNVVDYHDHAAGVFGTIFGAERVARFAELRASGAPGEAQAYSRELWAALPDGRAVMREAIAEQYETLFGAFSTPTYAIPGNVDFPALWPDFAETGRTALDGAVREIGGLRFGFVGGALVPPGGTPRAEGGFPYLRTRSDHDAAVRALGSVDVLCTHIPPAAAPLTYDERARRRELGSVAALELIERDRPRAALFGHVHQPLAARMRLGWTECVNVGHFQRTERAYVLRF